MVDNELVQLPIGFNATGNKIPTEISALADTTPFSSTNGTLTVLDAATIDGYSLRRLKVVGSW